MERAARLAVQEINDAGGVFVSSWNTKVNLTLVIADTINDAPANAVTPVTRAVETDHVDMLIGGYGSAGTLANEIIAIENRVPYIITGASNQLVTRRGPQGNYGGFGADGQYSISDAEGMRYLFHYCTTTYHYSKTVVDFFASEMKPMVAADRNFSLALLYRNDAFGTGVGRQLNSGYRTKAYHYIVADRAYDPQQQTTKLTLPQSPSTSRCIHRDNPDKPHL
jgi:ABC-type branched-subunit amino acid transport system substrate-binding protein